MNGSIFPFSKNWLKAILPNIGKNG